MTKSKEEVQRILGLESPPDDAFMALLAEVGEEEVVTGVRRITDASSTPHDIYLDLTRALVARSVGDLLAQARSATGYSLRQVGELLGVTRGRVQQLETSENIELATLVRFASAVGFGVKIVLEPEAKVAKNVQRPLVADLTSLAHV